MEDRLNEIKRTSRLEINCEYANGEVKQFSISNPRLPSDDDNPLTNQEITDLSTWMATNQPLQLYDLENEEYSEFVKISSAQLVLTTTNNFYEAEEGLAMRDVNAYEAQNGWKERYQ